VRIVIARKESTGNPTIIPNHAKPIDPETKIECASVWGLVSERQRVGGKGGGDQVIWINRKKKKKKKKKKKNQQSITKHPGEGALKEKPHKSPNLGDILNYPQGSGVFSAGPGQGIVGH